MTTASPGERTVGELPDDLDPWRVLGVSSIGVFLVVSALSSLNVALPNLQVDLGASAKQLQWIVDSYAVVFGGLLLTGGAISDRLGRRLTLLVGFSIVAAAGLVGGFATSVDVVIGARVLGGVGAAVMLPATLSVLTEVFSGPDEARAIAMWSGLAGAGGAIGPALGGWLISWSSWASVFFVNTALAFLGLVGTLAFVPSLPVPERRHLDAVGSALSILAIGGVLFAVIEAPGGWRRWEVIAGLLVGFGALVGFVSHCRRVQQPLLPLQVFDDPRVRIGASTLVLSAVGFAGVLFVGSLHLQFGWGESALAAGLLLLPIGAVEFVVAIRCVVVAQRIGTGRTIVVGLVLMAVGYLAMAVVAVGDRFGFVLASIVAGAGNGLVIPLSVERVVGGGDGELAGVRAGVNETSIELGASLGVAVLGGVQRVVFAQRLPAAVPSESFTEAIDVAGPGVDVVGAFVRGGRASLVVAAALVLLIAPWASRRLGDEP